MSYRKWITITFLLTLFFVTLVVIVNFYVDHFAVRLSLFSIDKKINQIIYPDGINQHTFNPEVIFRNPLEYDSFLFGSSRTAVIFVDKIPNGKYYNMSYPAGLPAQHLAIIRAFLEKGVKIKSVIIGLDNFCFSRMPDDGPVHLIRVMHPDAGGPSRLEFFGLYFFRKPDLKELSLWKDRVLLGKMKGRLLLNREGVNLGWLEKDGIIEKVRKPIFSYTVKKYEPVVYGQREMDESFKVIEELISLAHDHHFRLIFFITPFYSQLYINQAQSLFSVKRRLAGLTDYHDFSGFNSVTTDPMNYYEESHYRFRVGDLIVKRIFGIGTACVPEDFGVPVDRKNVDKHLAGQKRDLEKYLKDHHLQ